MSQTIHTLICTKEGTIDIKEGNIGYNAKLLRYADEDDIDFIVINPNYTPLKERYKGTLRHYSYKNSKNSGAKIPKVIQFRGIEK